MKLRNKFIRAKDESVPGAFPVATGSGSILFYRPVPKGKHTSHKTVGWVRTKKEE
jgi:hypothetical protein